MVCWFGGFVGGLLVERFVGLLVSWFACVLVWWFGAGGGGAVAVLCLLFVPGSIFLCSGMTRGAREYMGLLCGPEITFSLKGKFPVKSFSLKSGSGKFLIFFLEKFF